jgi:hypothetical protein
MYLLRDPLDMLEHQTEYQVPTSYDNNNDCIKLCIPEVDTFRGSPIVHWLR